MRRPRTPPRPPSSPSSPRAVPASASCRRTRTRRATCSTTTASRWRRRPSWARGGRTRCCRCGARTRRPRAAWPRSSGRSSPRRTRSAARSRACAAACRPRSASRCSTGSRRSWRTRCSRCRRRKGSRSARAAAVFRLSVRLPLSGLRLPPRRTCAGAPALALGACLARRQPRAHALVPPHSVDRRPARRHRRRQRRASAQPALLLRRTRRIVLHGVPCLCTQLGLKLNQCPLPLLRCLRLRFRQLRIALRAHLFKRPSVLGAVRLRRRSERLKRRFRFDQRRSLLHCDGFPLRCLLFRGVEPRCVLFVLRPQQQRLLDVVRSEAMRSLLLLDRLTHPPQPLLVLFTLLVHRVCVLRLQRSR